MDMVRQARTAAYEEPFEVGVVRDVRRTSEAEEVASYDHPVQEGQASLNDEVTSVVGVPVQKLPEGVDVLLGCEAG